MLNPTLADERIVKNLRRRASALQVKSKSDESEIMQQYHSVTASLLYDLAYRYTQGETGYIHTLLELAASKNATISTAPMQEKIWYESVRNASEIYSSVIEF